MAERRDQGRSAERVTIVTSSYPSHPDDPSGHFVRAHAHRLHRAGACVVVCAPGREGVSCEAGITVKRLGAETLFGWPGASSRASENPLRLGQAWGFVRRAQRAIGDVDRIVAHWLLPSAFPIAQFRPEPLEAWAHGADVRLLLSLPSQLRTTLMRRLLERATTFRFVAASLREALLARLPEELAHQLRRTSCVEPAPIDMPDFEQLQRPRAASWPAQPYAVWVGRLVASKRVDLAARVARAAGIALVVIGDGPERPPGGVVATGRIPRNEALAWIAHAKLLLSTSEHEGAPTVVREARALGVPVVATPAGDLRAWALNDPGIKLASSEQELVAALSQAG